MRAVSTAQILGDSGYLTFQVASLSTFLDPFDLESPLSYTVTDADRAVITTSASWDAGDFRIVFNQATLTTSSEPGGPVAGVPEPASWALMIMGFGGMGVTLRSRRRALAAI
ncbi:MAG: PEPxxWA-CTERM sorting domain-containing protein [Alphaproteobacteria bacterium]|nr:PEPxxWA-CTERM sorting domain-containing protein [Alphaproteobacteria bacterium]MBU1512820.1 PEPxxWA-CTERM sorting domain-containing protein [Alphaproteobacteria bacterium]MBU2095744.1 PEPxxWA-CTERM sorting domain-containing protein [Alphaproteobacteria bacterium]MBU2153200.1 PEPxxWA-CTERM sorting domain-containing protein [Alphaproteobacteria bacterium]MBU2308988.1 PEPxxWA-CTERM sorting domain-containing protein [Alphaproteobacteria bacterium]